MVMLEEPDVVVETHRHFIDAGARVLGVNNYAATPTRLARAGLESDFESIHQTAIQLLNRAIDESGVEPSTLSRMVVY